MWWSGLIGWFLPGETAKDRRARKLVVLLLVLAGSCAVMLAVQASQRAWSTMGGTATVGLVSTFGLFATRRGVSRWLVVSVVLTLGVSAAALMAIANGRDGQVSAFWMAAAPLIALGTGGQRAGWTVLIITFGAVVLTMVGIEHAWLQPFMSAERTLANRIISMLGMVLLVFLLNRASESEAEASIVRLEAQNRELLEARAEAERASRIKSEFLATISHEIRTPLNGVTGMATLLNSETDPAKVSEGLRLIRESADTLLAVISDVLDFSKIEANHLELEAVAVAPEREVRGVVALLTPRATERGNTLTLVVEPGAPTELLGDPTRLRQVVLNLVSNAVKFTSGGAVKVTVGRRDDWLLITVADTGIGMSADMVARLFQPFAQADASTTRRFGGTGLGLAISRRLVEAMKGTLEAESVEGQGATFRVALPIVVPPPTVRGPLLTPSAVPAVTPRRVLLVEDNAVNQVVATRLLERLGHRVTLAADGAQALALYSAQAFDVVLMDCHMPVMDGFQATEELRRRGCVQPIVALTAAVTTEDRERCLAAGMTSVLAKPLRLEQLAEVVGRA